MNAKQLAGLARMQRPRLRVPFVTGYADAAGLSSDELEPGMALIAKPFKVGKLPRRIRALIGD